MDWTYNTLEGVEKCVQGFGRGTWREETT